MVLAGAESMPCSCRLPMAVLLGQHLPDPYPPRPALLQVSEAEIKQAQRAEREADKMKGLFAKRFDFLDE